MADRGRDIKTRLISDAEQFDLSKPAQELEKLGEEALEAQRELDKLNDAEFNKLSNEAQDTAKKVDNAFEKIAKSSRSNLRKVDDDVDRAKKGMDDFREEAADTGREAAASFSGGFEDITDAVQEIGANAFAKLGPMGMAAGGALAMTLGFVVTKAQEANEKVKELRDNFFEFMKSNPGNEPAKALQEFMDTLDAEQIGDFDDALRATGISQKEFYAAMADGGEKAKAMKERLNAMIPAFNMPWDEKANEAQHLSHAIGESIKAHEGATGAAQTYLEVIGDSAEKQEEAAKAAELTARRYDSVASAVKSAGDATDDLTSLIQEKAQKQADATKSTEDAWGDYAATVKLSAADIARTLDEQTAAAESFRNDLLAVQKRGDTEFLEWVAQQPAAVAQAYADGTEAEKATIYAAFKKNIGVQMSLAIAKGIAEGRPSVAREAAITRAAAEAAATGQPIKLSIDVTRGFSNADIWAIRSEAQRQLTAAGALKVPVMLGAVQPGTWTKRMP